jgi:hypothetical protein
MKGKHMAEMMHPTHHWRALFFSKAADATPEKVFLIGARSEDEAAAIAHKMMLSYERIDLVRTIDKLAIALGESQLIEDYTDL